MTDRCDKYRKRKTKKDVEVILQRRGQNFTKSYTKVFFGVTVLYISRYPVNWFINI